MLPRDRFRSGGVRERHDARHRHGRLDQHGAAPAGRRQRGRGRFHHGGHRPAVAPRAGPLQGRAGQRRRTCTWRTSTAPAASWRSSANSTRRPAAHPRQNVHGRSPAHRPNGTSAAPGAPRPRSSSRPRPAACRRRSPSARTAAGGTRSRPRGKKGVHPRHGARILEGWRLCRALRQHRARRLHREDRRVDESILKFTGPARVFESQDAAVRASSTNKGKGRRRGGDPLRRPARRSGHAGNALSDQLPEIEGLWARPARSSPTAFLGGTSGSVHRPLLAGGRRGAATSGWSRKATAIEIDIPNPSSANPGSCSRHLPFLRSKAQPPDRPNDMAPILTPEMCAPTRY